MKMLVLILLLSGCAAPGDCGTIKMPPAQYRNPKVKADIRDQDYWSVDGTCRALRVKTDGDGRIDGCTYQDTTGWHHIMPLDYEQRACLLVHETAHLPPNPWPWNHPGAIFDRIPPSIPLGGF